MADKKTMVFFHDWLPLLKAMDNEKALEIVYALVEYDISGADPDIEFDSALEKAVFDSMLKMAQENKAAYAEKCAKNKERIDNYWKQKRANTNVNSGKPTYTDNDNDNDNDNENDNESDNDNDVFARPSRSDVKTYCQSRNNGINPDTFYDYYEVHDWKLNNGQTMKDWKAAVRNWENRDKEKSKKTAFQNFEQRTYADDLEERLENR